MTDPDETTCDRCGAALEPRQLRCPTCGIRTGLNWPGIFTGLALLGGGAIVAGLFRAIDWFMFLSGGFVAGAIGARIYWLREREGAG